MKGFNFSCTAPSSTAICTSIDGRSIVQPSNGHPRDSNTHHFRDSKRSVVINHLSHSFSKPRTSSQKSRKSTEKPSDLISPPGSSRYLLDDTIFFNVLPDPQPLPPLPPSMESQTPRLSPSCIQSIVQSPRFQTPRLIESPRLQPLKRDESMLVLKSSSSSMLPIVSPRLQPLKRDESMAVLKSSSSSMLPIVSPRLQPLKRDESMAVLKSSSSSMLPIVSPRLQPLKRDESMVVLKSSSSSMLPIVSPRLQPPQRSEPGLIRPPLSSSVSPRFIQLLKREESAALPMPSSPTVKPQDQVVVLRVSLHCKGCAGKVRKHIAKMEGVTSFNIDMAENKVTVIGDVTPLGVLNSVSKVKNAQLLMPLPPKVSASF